jgi:hypothetical protein
MFCFHWRFFALFALFTLLLWPLQESEARGARGGFGGSRSSARSSRPMYNPPATRSADANLSSKVNRSGSSQSRSDAIDARNSTSGTTRSGAGGTRTSSDGWRTGSAAPLPQSVRRPDGGYSPVYTDQNRGGSGFFDSAGQWILLSALINSGNRAAYQPQYAPSANAATEGPTHSNGNLSQASSSGSSLLGPLVLVVLVGGGIYLYRMSRAPQPGQKSDWMTGAFGKSTRSEPAAPPTPLDPWLALQPGSFLSLSDQQAIEDSQKRGGGVQGIDYTIENVGIAKDFDGFASWVLATLFDGHQRLLFMVKGDETHVEYRVYHASADFRPARREAVMARGEHWLFETPTSSRNFDAAKLLYATEIPYSAGGTDLHYIRKDHGERHCDYSEKPVVSGFGSLVATIAEYSTSEPTENPELLILEIATSKNKTGEVSLYFGTPVRASEVDIVRTVTA